MKSSKKSPDQKLRPHIGIDVRFFGPHTGGGLGRYTEELVRELYALKPNLDITLFCVPEMEKELAQFAPFRTISVDIPWYSLKEQIFLRSIIDRENLNLYHAPHFNVPIGLKTPFIVTIHDLILLEQPRSAHTSTRHPLIYTLKYWGFKKVLRHAIFKAKRIITISNTTKNSINKFFPKSKIPVDVIYPGIGTINDKPFFDRPNLPQKPFVLMVGNAYPHKNLSIVLKSLVVLKKEGTKVASVFAGRSDDFFEKLQEEAIKLGLNEKEAVFIKNPTDAELSFLYKNAEVFVFPSKCEGFGIPPLEAMAHGLPVVSSATSAMPEILGDAALFVDPDNEKDFAEAINLLITDSEKRKTQITKGLARSKIYSWEKMAQGVLKAYTEECMLE